VLRSPALSLCDPSLTEAAFSDHMALIFRPLADRFSAGTVNGSKTAQLDELLRELRDFR
jgi:hypothetical protein